MCMSRGKQDIEVIGHHAPDLARQVKALRLVLRRTPPVHESTAVARETETPRDNDQACGEPETRELNNTSPWRTRP